MLTSALSLQTIATPHLGVRNFTLFDEYNIHIHPTVKNGIASMLGATGMDLFVHDPNLLEGDSLVYRMSTSEEFLNPLRTFQRKRVYANLAQDLMVPLGTAAFLSASDVKFLRKNFSARTGVVHTMVTKSSDPSTVESDCAADKEAETETCAAMLPVDKMRRALDACGWEKVIVSFKGLYGFLPMAHNQIAAVSKFGTVIDGLLGFHEGRYVMKHAADWLTST